VKPPPVAYHRPATEEESIELLRQHGDDARVLGGGQSLVPMLNFRLARPERLIDVTRIASLVHIRARGQGLAIGAATRQSAIERSPLIATRWPLLHKAIAYVGHPQTRSRGTVGGSVAQADPAAELPVVLAALDGRVQLRSAQGARILDWSEFFQSEFVTACADDELVTGIELPAPRARTGVSFRECAARHGDFAIAGVACVISLDEDGRCEHASLALLACGPGPVRAGEAEQALVGRMPSSEAAAEAAQSALAAAEFRGGHTEVPSGYRGQVVRALVEDAVLDAARNATNALAKESGP
jgi:CO/xanthine dehydrogenase FAD-binding subunit